MKKFLAGLGILSLVLALAAPVLAATTVTATVTPVIVALSVTDGIVSYGVLDVGGTNNTFDGAATADTQLITSDGNVSIDVLLRSSDAAADGSPGVTDWDLAGTTDADQFVHSYDIDASGSASWTVFPSDGTFNNTNTASSVVTLANNADTA